MKTTTRKLRSPLKWFGGKSYLARRIIALMPPHRVFVEPFLGGGAILLNKPKAIREVAGDIDDGLIGFWMTLQSEPTVLLDHLSVLHYSESVFDHALENRLWGKAELVSRGQASPLMVAAINFLVRNRFSRGGLGKDFAWSDRLRGGQPGDVNAWDTIRAELPAIAERVRDVEFRCCPALDLIADCDGPDVLFYCDPPYCPSTRTARSIYRHEMTMADHAALLDGLRMTQGAVMLSGYRNPMYDAALAGWERYEFDMPNHSGQGKSKQRRTECLWIKPSEAESP